MKILESCTPGKVRIRCLQCQRYFEVDDFRNHPYGHLLWPHYENHACCPECRQRLERHEAELREQERRQRYLAALPQIVEAAGIPPNYQLSSPPVRFVAEWIYLHREENLLLSGRTGTGKSTGACFVALEMLKAEKRVAYTTLRELLAGWREAKTADWEAAPDAFLNQLCRRDVLIIDEMVEKARVSESGQELLFELLERVYNGECRAKLWLLGNFYTGSLEEIFADAEPVRRRLQETFRCAVIDAAEHRMKPIDVWSGRRK